jgi:ATP-dependent RNA helicase RhlE
VGGVNINPQLRSLRQQTDFIIGTPGRLKDLVERGAIHLDRINTIVLDEADRMLDMGFIVDMRYVMSRMPKERQTLFFSATMSADIEKVINEFLHEPVRVSVKTRDTSKNVDQDVVHIKSTEHKADILHELLSRPEFERVLVFGRTKHGVEKLATLLTRRGVQAESIHGNKDHNKRVRALNAFKQGRARVLVATDVAARGLDIPSVSHVINYDVPTTYEDYVHRIGRTGRADKKGIALTFIGSGMHVKDDTIPARAPERSSRAPREYRPSSREGYGSARRLA